MKAVVCPYCGAAVLMVGEVRGLVVCPGCNNVVVCDPGGKLK